MMTHRILRAFLRLSAIFSCALSRFEAYVRRMSSRAAYHPSVTAIEALRGRLYTTVLSHDDLCLIDAVMATHLDIRQELERVRLSAKRLRALIWGRTSEKARDVVPQPADASEQAESDASNSVLGASQNTDEESISPDGTAPASNNSEPKKKPKKGHGRNGADAYTGAAQQRSKHTLRNGAQCPECLAGRIYEAPPGVSVFFEGAAPIQATVVTCEKKTCNVCRKTFVAPMPPEFDGKPKYGSSVAVIIAMMHYWSGMTFYALEKFQDNVGVPVASSTQYELVAALGDDIRPAFDELLRHAAQGTLFHNDDTTMTILPPPKSSVIAALIADNDVTGDSVVSKNGTPKTAAAKDDKKTAAAKAASGSGKSRSVKTTCVLSYGSDATVVSIFATGEKHAGNVLAEILGRRSPELAMPVQMCDALAENLPNGFATDLANCNAHARRQFVDIFNDFPTDCNYVIDMYTRVYTTDAYAREHSLSDDERLKLHQSESGPLFDALKARIKKQQLERHVEPNSTLGGIYKYMLKHWEALTLFLRRPGVPLDNNVCERALKMAIKHRNNSLFYKTAKGAANGDMFMSIIHTCTLNGVSAFSYLNALVQHATRVRENASAWMPWNYCHTIKAIGSVEPLPVAA